MTAVTRGDFLDSRVGGTWGPAKINFVLYIISLFVLSSASLSSKQPT